MSEDIKGLIEKINREGIKQAEEKAAQITAEAKKQAQLILQGAKEEAQRLLLEAQAKIRQDETQQRSLLAQAGRDFLLSLRKEIQLMLERLIKQEIRNSLTPEGLAKIISGLLKPEALAKAEAVISLQKEDLEALEKFFFTRLKEELRKGIVLRPEQEINAGFTISFDRGRSQFDFTDKALAEYIAGFLKPKLNQLFKEALEK